MRIPPSFREVDRFSRVCPVGLRFWDPVDAGWIDDGLEVFVRPVGQEWPRQIPNPGQRLRATRRGAWVGHDLAGLGSLELGQGDEAYWADVGVGREYDLDVTDTLDRFVPVRLRTRLPVRGWCSPACVASPPNLPLGAVPLFSSSSRPVPAGRAVVRMDLWDTEQERPAAWALLTVTAQTPTGPYTATGMAGANGSVAVIFAYPELPPPSGPTSPPTQGMNLSDQSWPLLVDVRYGALTGEGAAAPEVCTVLAQPLTSVENLIPPVLLATRELSLFSSTDLFRRGRVVPG